jgi:hypothetical protein
VAHNGGKRKPTRVTPKRPSLLVGIEAGEPLKVHEAQCLRVFCGSQPAATVTISARKGAEQLASEKSRAFALSESVAAALSLWREPVLSAQKHKHLIDHMRTKVRGHVVDVLRGADGSNVHRHYVEVREGSD